MECVTNAQDLAYAINAVGPYSTAESYWKVSEMFWRVETLRPRAVSSYHHECGADSIKPLHEAVWPAP